MKKFEKRLTRIEADRPTGTIILGDDWPIPEQRGLEAPADIWQQILERCAADAGSQRNVK